MGISLLDQSQNQTSRISSCEKNNKKNPKQTKNPSKHTKQRQDIISLVLQFLKRKTMTSYFGCGPINCPFFVAGDA